MVDSDKVIIADAHCDFLSKILDNHLKLVNEASPMQHVTMEGLLMGNVKIQFFAAWVGDKQHHAPLERCLELIDAYHNMLDEHIDQLVPISQQFLASMCNPSSPIGTLLTIEGGEALAGKISHLHNYYRLGVRLLTLTWNYRNEIGDGIAETRGDGGLSNFGYEVIHEMNKLKMIIDVSHLNEKGFWDVLHNSKEPIMASHSNARIIHNHPRNLTDEQIKAISSHNGYIGINFYPNFLGNSPASINDILSHINHITSLVGTDHIGFGADFDGIDILPQGIAGPQSYQKIVKALYEYGYCKEDIEKICYKNLARFLSQFV